MNTQKSLPIIAAFSLTTLVVGLALLVVYTQQPSESSPDQASTPGSSINDATAQNGEVAEIFQQNPAELKVCEAIFTIESMICGEQGCVTDNDCEGTLVCASNGYCAMPEHEDTCNATSPTTTCCQPEPLECGEYTCTDDEDCEGTLVCASNGYCAMPEHEDTCNATSPTTTCCEEQLGSIGDYVWDDLNHNGVQDAGETPNAGVKVELLNAAGAVIATQTSGADGKYLFTGLPAGSYTVRFTLPNGYQWTSANNGTNDAIDSDPNTDSGLTGEVILAAGENDLTWDAGKYRPTTPTPTPTVKITPSPTVTPSPTITPTATPMAGCYDECDYTYECPGSMECLDGRCKNPDCREEGDCVCNTPTPPAVPQLPRAGGLPPTLLFTLGGIVLVALGLLF